MDARTITARMIQMIRVINANLVWFGSLEQYLIRRSLREQLLLELSFRDDALLDEELGYSIRHGESGYHKLLQADRLVFV